MNPVWVEGEGVISERGEWFTEEQVRQAAERIAQLCTWFNSLATETQDFIRWEAGQ